MKVYLAGPDVFLPDGKAIGRRKVEFCARYGLHGLYPLDNDIDPAAPGASLRIFLANQRLMDDAEAILVNLTPFRGPGADPGSVYELGYMAGRGKRCFGYTNDNSLYADRVAAFVGADSDGGQMIDADGLIVENFGLADNLMMIHALDQYGSALVMPTHQPDDVWHDDGSFKACVRLAAGRLSASSVG